MNKINEHLSFGDETVEKVNTAKSSKKRSKTKNPGRPKAENLE